MLTRPVTWVGAREALSGEADLSGLGSLRVSITEANVEVRPEWVWDPSDTGLPTSFSARTNYDYAGGLSIATGFLDGHDWVLDRDLTIFTSDIPTPDDVPCRPEWGVIIPPFMNTDDDTLIKLRAGTHSVWIEPRGTAEFADGFAAVSAEPSNWGSFVLRVLPKLFEAAQHDAPVLAYVNHANQRLMAKLVGIRPSNLVHHETWLRYNLRNVQLPILPTSAMWVSPRLKATYDAIAHLARALHPDTTRSPRVYLSRRGYWGRRSKRTLVNEEQLISELEARGFHILYPDNLPASLVTAIVSQAEIIVTLGGAGLYNVVFASEDATVIDIEGQDTFLHGHTNLLTGAVRRWGLFYGFLTDPTNTQIHQPFEIDLGAFLRALDDVA